MTLVVAVRPGHANAAPLALAGELADALGEPVVAAAVTLVPPGVPSPLRIGMTDEAFFELVAASAIEEARSVLGERLVGVRAVGARSVRAGLLDVLDREQATALVLGSADRGEPGRTRVGDVASAMLHSAQVPVHLTPVGYSRAFQTAPIRQLTVAFGPGDGSLQALEYAARLADRVDSMLRTISFFVRDASGTTPLGGAPSYHEQITEAWHEQMTAQVEAAVRGLDRLGLPSRFITTGFGDGTTWRGAIDAVDWAPGEMLVVGSRARGGIRSVFLGSRAVEILHHAPVPVTVLPG